MPNCGCLTEEKKNIVAEVLDVYTNVIEDQGLINAINTIKSEIESCKCSTSGGKKEEKSKRGKSDYNKHTSKCMKEGKTMKQCAVIWNELKKEKSTQK